MLDIQIRIRIVSPYDRQKHSLSRRTKSLVENSDYVASGATEFRAVEDHGSVLDHTRRPRFTREARLEPSIGVSTEGRCGIAPLRLLVSPRAHDQLRRGARRESRADQERIDPDGQQNETLAWRQLHLRAEQRQACIRDGSRDRR